MAPAIFRDVRRVLLPTFYHPIPWPPLAMMKHPVPNQPRGIPHSVGNGLNSLGSNPDFALSFSLKLPVVEVDIIELRDEVEANEQDCWGERGPMLVGLPATYGAGGSMERDLEDGGGCAICCYHRRQTVLVARSPRTWYTKWIARWELSFPSRPMMPRNHLRTSNPFRVIR